ncbi:fibronectin type III domain-containing protein 7-like [Polyodon spathula]|uniref:fibronectin type III domain-containing protein 7-like n=1 Tax=Polyodon spathula TaxID=7913 RepID=UPI001B7F4835|nr:fibronectin type III domain-containing protein 7-like [Polyodon spathula]
MGTSRLAPCMIIGFINLCMTEIAATNKEFSVSIYTVTSKSISVQWARVPGIHSVKVTATPKTIPTTPVFVQFSGATIIGSIVSLTPNIIYTVKVEAIDSLGTVLASSEIVQPTAPDVPSIDQVYSKQSSSITVEWTAVPGATGYTLRAEDGKSIIETTVTGSPGTIRNLDPATQYEISLMSVNAGGRSQPSLPKKVKTVLAAPVLSSSSPSNDSIVVTWEPVYMAVEYTLSLMRADGVGSRLKVNTSQTTMTFSRLDSGIAYSIKANAWDSSHTQGDDFSVTQITRPAVPSSVELSMIDRSMGVDVSWSLVEGAEIYTVLGSSRLNCTSVFSSCSISPLDCGNNYSVSVVASNKAGPSSPSEPANFLTVPCAPQGIRIEEVNPGNLTVSWSIVPLGKYYIVYVKRDDGLEGLCNTSLSTCYYQFQCGFTYFTTVFAYNAAGQSPLGSVLNYTTAPCCPADIKPAFVSGDTLEIIWSPARGAEEYEIKADDGFSVIHCNDTATVCALSMLKCNTRYSVIVSSCSEIRGCNTSCVPHYITTAPCSPQIKVTKLTPFTFNVSWSSDNKKANYTVTIRGGVGLDAESRTHRSSGNWVVFSNLSCGSTFYVNAIATSPEGESLPSYTVPLETAPCCPQNLTVTQVTQAMTNVSWSVGRGAQSYVTMLESLRGEARCHTLQSHCLLGCISCGTNYTVSLQSISDTGLTSECTYQGYSSSACCPSNVRLYRLANNAIRVYWHATGGSHNYTADLYGSNANYACSPSPGSSSCDISEVSCGDVYTVVVSPMSSNGSKVTFCLRKVYLVSCSGSNFGIVIYQVKRISTGNAIKGTLMKDKRLGNFLSTCLLKTCFYVKKEIILKWLVSQSIVCNNIALMLAQCPRFVLIVVCETSP